MSNGEPNFSVDFTARVLGTLGAVAKGDALVFDPTYTYKAKTGFWLRADDATRASTGSGADAIALTAYGGASISKVAYQASGVVPKEISGLDALTPGSANKLVRVSSAGRLERVDSYTAGDDIVGYARWNGRVCLHIGLPWNLIASYAGGTAALPANSVQASNPDATFRAATHATISNDGRFEARSKTAGAQPTVGEIRGDDGGLDDAEAWSIANRMQDGTTMRPVWSFSGSGDTEVPGGIGRFLWHGNASGATYDKIFELAHYIWGASVRGSETDQDKYSYATLQYVPGTSPSAGLTGRRWFALSSYTNFFMCGDNNTPANPEDALGGGESVISLGVAKVEPTSSPASGFTILWPRRSDSHFVQRIGGTVYDLTAPGKGSAGQLQTSNGSGILAAPGPYAGADYISLIAGTPDVPGVRLANNTALTFRNFGGTADIVACYVDSSNNVRVGSAFDATQTGILFATPTGHRFTFNFDTTAYAYLSETEFAIDVPRHGYTTPYASEGQATFAVTLTAHTLTPTEYTRRIIKFTGSLGGTSTITLPAPANADASYVKGIRNTSTSTLTLTKGSGTTASVAAGTNVQVMVTPDGVF